jgi:hypothetical protein
MTATAATAAGSTTTESAVAGRPGSLDWLASGAGLVALTGAMFLPWLAAVAVAAGAAVLALVALGMALASRGPGIGHGVAGLVTGLVALVLAVSSTVLPEFDLALVGGDRSGTDGDLSPLPGPLPGSRTTEPAVQEEILLLPPATVDASGAALDSTDAAGNTVTFDAFNAVDGDPTTAWRVPGDGVNDHLVLTFDRPVHVAGIGMIPGYAKIDPVDGADRFAQNRRVSSAQFEFSDGQLLDVDFTDQPQLQTVTVGVETTQLTMWITASTPAPRDFTAVSELEVYGWTVR